MAKGLDLSNMSDPRTMALMGLASGLLQNSGYSTRPITFGEALGSGVQNGMQGYASGVALQGRQQEMAMQQAQHEMLQNELQRKLATQQYLREAVAKSGGDRKALQQALYQSGDLDLMKQAASLGPKVKSTVKGFGADGKPTYQNVFEDGSTESTGIAPAEKAMQVNQGSQISFLDPYSLQNRGAMGVSMAPGEAARLAQSERQFAASHGLAQQNAGLSQQKQLMDMLRLKQELDPEFQAQKQAGIALAKDQAKAQSEARTRLPEIASTLAETLNLSDDLKNHPALEDMTGTSRFIGNAKAYIGGNKEAEFKAKFDQATGKQFLSSIHAMRGFGQLTEREGDKMQASASAMSQATDAQAFKKAQDEYQAALLSGVRKIAKQAGVPEQEALNMLQGERDTLRRSVQQPQPAANNGGFSIRRIE